MRVVLFDWMFEDNKPGMTGLSDLVWNWAIHLVMRGDEVHIVAPYDISVIPPEGVIVHRFPVPVIGYRNMLGHILIILRGLQEIRKIQNIDLIQAPEYLSTAIFSLIVNSPITLVTPGNIFERIDNFNPFDWFTTQVYKIAAIISARRCARIISTGEQMTYWWKRSGATNAQIVNIPLGVDTRFFGFRPSARQKLGIDENPNILFVGRFHAENGLENVITAFAHLKKLVPSLKLDIVGYGPEEVQLKRLADYLEISKDIRWHGRVNLTDLPLYYSAATVFVLPRFSRVTPRVIFEAMSCGLPVVTSNIGGIQEFVQTGEMGFLIDPSSVDSIVDAVGKILFAPELRQKMGTRAREYVEQNLDWEIIVDKLRTEVFIPLVNGSR